MACLGGGNKQNYQNFDIENLQQQQQQDQQQQQAPKRSAGGSKCLSLPVLLAATALLLSIIALALGISAAVKTRRLGNGPADGLYLTSDPRSVPAGWSPVNLFKVTCSFQGRQGGLGQHQNHHQAAD
jgi:hypothetical protein